LKVVKLFNELSRKPGNHTASFMQTHARFVPCFPVFLAAARGKDVESHGSGTFGVMFEPLPSKTAE
jgi:hypothetical protein